MDAVFQDPHTEWVVELCPCRDSDKVRLGLDNHLVQVSKPGGDTELVAEGVQPFLNQITQCDHFGTWMGVIGAPSGGASSTTSQNCDTIGFHTTS